MSPPLQAETKWHFKQAFLLSIADKNNNACKLRGTKPASSVALLVTAQWYGITGYHNSWLMLSPNCFFHDASERQSEVWRKSRGDSETKPIHMHTHIRILSPPPKHSMGPVAPSTSWIPPAILKASVWACIHWKEREDAHIDPYSPPLSLQIHAGTSCRTWRSDIPTGSP